MLKRSFFGGLVALATLSHHTAPANAQPDSLTQAQQKSHAMLEQPGFAAAEFIFTEAPFLSCHASTIAQTPSGLVCAWFAGDEEGARNVGIWSARKGVTDDSWTRPVEIARGDQHPCWNPVLFQQPDGPLHLFYKEGPRPSSWWGMHQTSADGGLTWTPATRLPTLPQGIILGPVRAKPILLDDGRLLCGSSTEDQGWRVHFEWTSDWGRSWERTAAANDGRQYSAIQPTFLRYADGRIQALCRSRQGKIVQVWSSDGGKTWEEMTATQLPNPSAGIDSVALPDGTHLLVYNHTLPGRRDRSFLNLARTKDGTSWQAAGVLEDQEGEFSYPAMIRTSDGRVHITYTWLRKRIRHVVLDPTELKLRPIDNGRWPEPRVVFE